MEAPMHANEDKEDTASEGTLADEFAVTPLRQSKRVSPGSDRSRLSVARLPIRLRRWLSHAGVLALLALGMTTLLLTQLTQRTQLAPPGGTSQAHAPTATDEITSWIPSYPTPSEGTVSRLELAPRSCPATTLRAFNPNDAFRGVGHDPVWIGFFFARAGASATLRPVRKPFADEARFGFPVPLVIETVPGATEPITITATDSARGTPLWFVPDTNSGQKGPAIGLVIDPRDPHIPLQTGEWKSWLVTLYLPRSGCFNLAAVWASGSWLATAAGGV
jgi:hypothetical protein